MARDRPSFDTNVMVVWGVERRLRETFMSSGRSMCNAHEGTENETTRGEFPDQEDGSGSKTTSGRASVPEGVSFPNPTFKEAKILWEFKP